MERMREKGGEGGGEGEEGGGGRGGRGGCFFFNDTATTEIYTLSLHDALPISTRWKFIQAFAHIG